MKDAPGGEWTLLSTEVTDKTGRISYTIPESKALGYGVYPIKMVVRFVHPRGFTSSEVTSKSFVERSPT